MAKLTLQHFELHVLLAMLREPGETYSVPLVLALEKRTGRPVAQAAVFIALRRLERKGLVMSRLDEPDSGRARRYFTRDARKGWRPSRRIASSTRGSGRASAACSAPARPDHAMAPSAARRRGRSPGDRQRPGRAPRLPPAARRRRGGRSMAATSTTALPLARAPRPRACRAPWMDHHAASLARRALHPPQPGRAFRRCRPRSC